MIDFRLSISVIHNSPCVYRVAHSGMLGAAKWLLEKEGLTLKKLLSDNPVCGNCDGVDCLLEVLKENMFCWSKV